MIQEIDYTIPGTPIFDLIDIEYATVNWLKRKEVHNNWKSDFKNMISFGVCTYNGIEYLKIDNPEFRGTNTICIKLDIFKEFAKKQNKLTKMEKELTGYKLIKPEYANAVNTLVGVTSFNFDRFKTEFNNFSTAILDLKKAGVLDLWFEPVYKEDIPKIMLPRSEYQITIDKEKNGIYIDTYFFSKLFLNAAKVIQGHDKANVVLGCGAKNNYVGAGNQWFLDEKTIDVILKQLNS